MANCSSRAFISHIGLCQSSRIDERLSMWIRLLCQKKVRQILNAVVFAAKPHFAGHPNKFWANEIFFIVALSSLAQTLAERSKYSTETKDYAKQFTVISSLTLRLMHTDKYKTAGHFAIKDYLRKQTNEIY